MISVLDKGSADSVYQAATAHYLSPKRRDPVKVLMEEPVSHAVFADAVTALDLPPGEPLRVLDLGSGTGDGYALLTEEHGGLAPVTDGRELRYLGVDADAAMVETARALRPGAEFRVGDMRDPLPRNDFQLHLSCGVPYSHLTVEECTETIAGILRAATGPIALVVDVLGRYSVEWTPNWASRRWNYAMTFFEDTSERVEQLMTFYDRHALQEVLDDAAGRAGLSRYTVTFVDRSVLVGRHTSTSAFNRSIPPYRKLVNALADGGEVRTADLRFAAPTSGAPDAVLEFFQRRENAWNALLGDTAETSTVSGNDAQALAQRLLHLERTGSPGLGVGHSLTATMVVDP